MPNERRQLSHLRADARWCTFRDVATNVIPGSRTIGVYECECGIAIRLVEYEEPAVERIDSHTGSAPSGGTAPEH